MTLIVDTREKPRAIVKILTEFSRQGVKVVRRALNFADYWNPENPKVIIDRKQNLQEVVMNVTDYSDPRKGLKRFKRELIRCNRAGCRMIILVEHGGRIHGIEDVMHWKNPRLKVSPYAISGERLYKKMKAMESYYGIEWKFCSKGQTGKKIIELLEVKGLE